MMLPPAFKYLFNDSIALGVKFVASAIMNQLSYHVSKEKLNKEGLILKSNLNKDIKATIKLLDNI